MVRFELETPLRAKESGKRNLDPLTCRLLIDIKEENDIPSLLSEYIYKSRIGPKQLVAQTIVCYDSVKKVRRVLEQADLQCCFDSDVVQSIKKPQNVIINCASQHDVLFALSRISAEAIVFYNLAVEEGRPEINEAILACSIDGYFEHNFLRHQDQVGCFIFYQATHDSIELLGSREAILGYFGNVCL